MLKILRTLLFTATPILSMNLELSNLRRENKNDFVYSDYSQYMGKFHSVFLKFRFRVTLKPFIRASVIIDCELPFFI
jgi:hypothetical protein